MLWKLYIIVMKSNVYPFFYIYIKMSDVLDKTKSSHKVNDAVKQNLNIINPKKLKLL